MKFDFEPLRQIHPWRGIVLPRQTEMICLQLCKVQSYKLEGQERQRPGN